MLLNGGADLIASSGDRQFFVELELRETGDALLSCCDRLAESVGQSFEIAIKLLSGLRGAFESLQLPAQTKPIDLHGRADATA